MIWDGQLPLELMRISVKFWKPRKSQQKMEHFWSGVGMYHTYTTPSSLSISSTANPFSELGFPSVAAAPDPQFFTSPINFFGSCGNLNYFLKKWVEWLAAAFNLFSSWSILSSEWSESPWSFTRFGCSESGSAPTNLLTSLFRGKWISWILIRWL